MKQKEKLLFVCMMNIDRSITAEKIFAEEYETKSCGVANTAKQPITIELIDWADKIFVMDEYQKRKITYMKPEAKDKTYNLDVPDLYVGGDPKLKKQLEEKIRTYL